VHEWALAEAVVSTASRIAKEEGLRRIAEIRLRIGELQQIDLGVFKFALSQLCQQFSLDARFEFEVEKAEFKCKACGHIWEFNKDALDPDAQEAVHVIPEVAHAFIKCPKCGSPDFEVMRGRGIWIESVRGER